MEKLKTIRLYGKLGAKFGRVHRFAVNSVAETVQCLSVMIPGFEKELMSSKDRGVGYACFIGKQNLSEDEVNFPAGKDDIRIAPMIMGSKRGGIFQMIIGAMLIAASFFVPQAGILGIEMLSATLVFSMGTAMFMGGAVQLLSPQMKGLGSVDRPENGASYHFNGPVNTTAQGNPVPILYGELIVGGAIISSGIYAEDMQ